MQEGLDPIKDAGVQIVGISYDSIEVLKSFAEKQKITFSLLSDPESKTIAAYALKNKEMEGQEFGKIKLDGVPYPGTLLVDRNGIVRAKLFLDDYRQRHSVAELVEAAKNLTRKP